MNKKSLIINCSLLTLLIADSVFAEIYDSLRIAKNEVENISVSSFKNSEPYLKKSFLDDIENIDIALMVAEDEIDVQCKNALYKEISNTVNLLIAKSKGCIENNKPDPEDWIVNCNDASKVNKALKQLEADIKDLIQ